MTERHGTPSSHAAPVVPAQRSLPLDGQPGGRGTAGSQVRRTAALAATAALLLSGCGTMTESADTSPITVMTWAPDDTKATDKPGMTALARAYARSVNAKGGIGGHELRVLTCNDHNDPVGAAECARRAVQENVVAVVGSYSQHGRSFLSPLEAAGIPYIGGYGLTDDEFTSPLSYPVNGGQPAVLAGLGLELGDECGDVAMVRPDTVAGDAQPRLLDAGLAKSGLTTADIVAAEDATEYGRQADAALNEATSESEKGCVATVLGERTDTFIDSFRRSEDDYPDVRLGSVLGSVDQSLVDRTGGAGGPYEGAYVAGWYPVSSDPRWDGMRKMINEHAFGDNSIDPADAGVQTTWIAYEVLRAAVKSLDGKQVTADSLRRTFDDGLKVNTGGLTPTLSWRFEDLIAVRDFPRLVNADVTFQVVRDGRLVSARRGFVDVSPQLEEGSV